MAKVVVMPKLGYTQDEGTIAEWHKKEGDQVAIGEAFFDVHTDKSVITVDASCAGTVLKIALEPGETVPVLTPVAVVGEPGEDADAILASHVTAVVADAQIEADFDDDDDDQPAQEEDASPAAAVDVSELKLTPRAKKYIKENEIDPASVAAIKGTGFEGGITERDVKASPLARKLAEKTGVDLASVQGTGAGGKVMKKDVEAAASAPAPAGTDELQIASVVPYKGVRKIIGDKLAYLYRYLEDSHEPSPLLKEKVEKGELGFKTGGVGMQTWTPEEMKAYNDGLITNLIKVGKALDRF